VTFFKVARYFFARTFGGVGDDVILGNILHSKHPVERTVLLLLRSWQKNNLKKVTDIFGGLNYNMYL
jgi:hypothetical protein